ncbi:MAG: outer membrane protein transport protein, partial [Nitrospirales bacterium]
MHTEKSRSLACAWALMLVMLAGPSWAGGLYLSEYGSPSMGVAGAGAQAVAADAATAFHNPAGMTRLDSNQLMLTGGFLYGSVKFDAVDNTPIAGGDGGDAGGFAPILGTYYAHRVTNRLSLGASLVSITGAALEYDDGWAGRELVTKIELLSVTLIPVIAYRITDRLSVGAGPLITYGKLDIRVALPSPLPVGSEAKIDGDDVAFGFTASTLFELTERTRFGVYYQSKIDLDFD